MRLVTFGCSHTYGEGILPEDLLVTGKRKPPSKASWAAKLANKLNCELKNLGQPAASVNYVVERLLSYRPMPNDIIAISFPNLNRFTLFDVLTKEHVDKNCYIVPRGDKNIHMQKKLYDLFDDYNLLRMNTKFVDYAYRILESYNLPYVCRFAVYPYIDKIVDLYSSHEEAIALMKARSGLVLSQRFLEDLQKPTLIHHRYDTDEKNRYGADGRHFSELIHEKYALDFYNEFTNMA